MNSVTAISRRTFLGGVASAAVLPQLGCLSFTDRAQAWKRGDLQIHFLYTGVGEQMFYIFPDGTTMLLDCGVIKTEGRDPAPIPETVKGHPVDWIADYIERVNPAEDPTYIDYMMTSHYHADHTDGYPRLIERMHFGKAFDRCWPDVNFPCKLSDFQPHELKVMTEVYDRLVKRDGLKIEKWTVGERDQLKLLHGGAKDFSVFNLCANGFVASETTGEIVDLYKDYPDKQPGFKGNQFGKQWINENGMSVGFILTYGKFRYYSAGDFSDRPYGHNVENEMAPFVKPVTAAKMNHHGYYSMYDKLTAALAPKEWFACIWNHNQNTKETIDRITDRKLYPGARRIHSCFFTPRRPCADVADSGLYEGRTVVLTVREGGDKYDIEYLYA